MHRFGFPDAPMTGSVADNRIRSVITFDRGGRWRQLNKPENVDCDTQVQKVHFSLLT